MTDDPIMRAVKIIGDSFDWNGPTRLHVADIIRRELGKCESCERLRIALAGLVQVIEADELMPESLSYFRDARQVLADYAKRREGKA